MHNIRPGHISFTHGTQRPLVGCVGVFYEGAFSVGVFCSIRRHRQGVVLGLGQG